MVVSGSNVHKRGAGSYFDWLVKKVRGNEISLKPYDDILWQLHSIDFRYSIPNDINRIADGMKLRDWYISENGKEDFSSWPCSVFEVLIGLARRISEDVIGDEDGHLLRKWFWEMLHNLGVLNYAGRRYDRGRICTLIEVWISRSFEPDGGGSPFPLKAPEEDQRRVEIWTQICSYLAENPSMEE